MKSTNSLQNDNEAITDFLGRLSSSAPTPGGGGAAALTGAISAALVSMVANLTKGKAGYEEVWDKYERIENEASQLRRELLNAVEADAKAFDRVMDAYRLPGETEEEKKEKKKGVEKALKQATEPPFDISDKCRQVLELSDTCAKSGNSHAITDAGAAAILADAALRTALLNVDINLISINDEQFVTQARSKRERTEEISGRKMHQVVQKMNERMVG